MVTAEAVIITMASAHFKLGPVSGLLINTVYGYILEYKCSRVLHAGRVSRPDHDHDHTADSLSAER